jgi:hypothetical protein
MKRLYWGRVDVDIGVVMGVDMGGRIRAIICIGSARHAPAEI